MNIPAQSLIQSLTDIQSGFAYLWPEIILVAFFLLLIALDLIKSPALKTAMPWVTLTGIIVSLGFQLIFLNQETGNKTMVIFTGLLVADGLAHYAGLLFSIAGLLAMLLSFLSSQFKSLAAGKGEYCAYILVLLAGLNLMVKSVNLLMLFVALELVSIASYLLTAIFKKDRGAVESGMKYILYGTLASGIMLYGMSFLYGFGGSLYFTDTAFWDQISRLSSPFFLVIFLFTLAGFLFKISAAPFHFWTPDVYAGAPLPIVAFFSTAPKIAGFIVIIRMLLPVRDNLVMPLQSDLMVLIGGIALFSLVVGNFTALWQRNARRLLAYSSVAHAGFILAALAALQVNSLEAVLFYLSVLLFMNFGIFFLVQIFEEKFFITDLKGLAGLGRTYPTLGTLAIIILISLTGLPPTAGFTGKLVLFTNIWQNYASSGNQILLVLLLAGLLVTGVAFFYYIQIPYYLFFKGNLTPVKKVLVRRDTFILILLTLPLLIFFVKPDWLTMFIKQVVHYSN